MDNTLTRSRKAFRRVVTVREQNAVRANCLSHFEVVQGVANHHDLLWLPRKLLNPLLALGDFTLGINIVGADWLIGLLK